MAQAVDTIDGTAMTTEQVQGIVEYIPTQAEQKDLKAYMSAPGLDVASKFEALCECEKFMVAMMTVKHSKNKIRALLFKLQFESCMKDLMSDTTTVEKSCDELSNSIRLRKLLGIVLNVGNRLNTAGPSEKGKAGAFTLDSLLKLNQAKAFDKKTTFLHYVVLVVQRNNELLVRFKDDLPTVMKAEKVYWDQCLNDLEEVENQLENIRKISLHQANEFSKGGKRNVGDDDDSLSDISISLEDEVRALRSSAVGIFTLDAIKKVSALREKVETTQTKFAKVLEYFGEEEKMNVMQPHELFQIIATFCKNFDTAREEVAANTKLKLREERKRQARNGNTKVQGTRIYPSDNAVETMKSRSQDSELNPSRSFQSCASIDSTKGRVISTQPNRSFARNGLEGNGSNGYSNPAARQDHPSTPDPVWKAKSANTRFSQSSGHHEAQPPPSYRSKLPDPEPSVSSRQYERQSHVPPQPSYSQPKMNTKNSWQTHNRDTPGSPDPEPTKVSSYQPSPTQHVPQYSQPSHSRQSNEPRVNCYPVQQKQQQQPTESLSHSRRKKEISIQTSQAKEEPEPAHSQSTAQKSSSTSGISPDEKLRQKARMRRRMGQGTLSPTSGPASPPVPSSSSPSLTKTMTPGSVTSQARARQRRRDRLTQIKSSAPQTSPRASSPVVDWPVQAGN
uniref:FH2 domain-containing protein n=1 Tax=Attheya septentrionalis TaxID=420275 RepID=A0A7S2XPA2_9STRA|mmetsp:Transcript_24029/g.43444  ORF Transcript_24029/g.43444 Transcript_24029/m.43444 type:complete len:675 (+) Transcript_24029:3-2027(+)